MEAAVSSSSSGLCCSLNPVPKQQQQRSARVGFATKRQPCAVTCKRLLFHPNARVYTAAVARDSDAGNAGVRRKRLAVFVSGGGSNFRSIHEAAMGGRVKGDVVVLVTDKPGCGGAKHARSNGIPVVVFSESKSAPEGVSTDELLNALRRYSGPTMHCVDEQYDTGRTLAQRVVPVLANDTPKQLAARVLHEEHKVYVEAAAALCEDRIAWQDDGVPLIRSQTNPDEYT